MEPAKVATTSKPMKLNRMMERYVSESGFARSGRKVSGPMGLAKPFSTANHTPTPPTTSVMNTLITAPPLRIQSASLTGEHAAHVTPHTKTSSTPMRAQSGSAMPQTPASTLGKMQATLAIQRGKFTQ